MKKEPIPSSQELLDLSFELSKLHLNKLMEKSRTPDGLTPHEGNAVCTYLKTFSSISKLEKQLEKEALGEVGKLSDEELRAELDKLVKQKDDDASN
jgi:hypothetical protein